MTSNETRKPMNSVKSQVHRSALELREFTVAEMVRATGCKRASVQTELGRMANNGYLVAEPIPGPHNTPGKPRLRYRLSEDRERLEGLIRGVKSFRQPRPERGARPKSRHYTLARNYLEKAFNHRYQSNAGRSALLDEAVRALQLAWADEGNTGTVTDAFIRYEQAKLLFLKDDYDRAEALFLKAREAFAASEEYESWVVKIDQYLNSIELVIAARQPTCTSLRLGAIMQSLRDATGNLSVDFPLPAVIQSLLGGMVSTHQQVLETAWEQLGRASEVPEYIRVVGGGTFEQPVQLKRAFCPWGHHRPAQETGITAFETISLGERRQLESRELEVAVRGAVGTLYSSSPYDYLVEDSHGQKGVWSIVQGVSTEV